MWVDLVYRIETGCSRPCDKKIPLRAERKVISGDARLEGRKNEDLAVAGDLENRSTAIAHVQVMLAVECDASGDAHSFGVGGHASAGSHLVDRTVISRGRIHLSFAIKRNRRRVHHVRHE